MNPVVLFSLLIFSMTVQVWLVLVYLSSLMPPVNVLTNVVWPEWQYFVQPERDALLFHSFVAMALGGQAVGIWLLRQKLNQPSFIKGIWPFLATELAWTALMLNASFKIIVYPNSPQLAKGAFIILTAGALLSKIFWPEFKSLAQRFYLKLMACKFDYRADILVCLGLVLLLYVPDTTAVLARMFFGDHFHHFDSFLGPAWSYHKGAILNVDVITEYGIGIPVAMAWFAKAVGGFSYGHLLWFWMAGEILYFILCFIFVRRWLGSFGLALVTVLLAVKFQMFHYTMAPFIFTFPSSTAVRFFWDIIFLMLLLGHVRRLRPGYLWAAACCCGLQIFWMTTSGYCLTITLMAYITTFMVLGHLRKLVCKKSVDVVLFCLPLWLVPLTAIFLLSLTQGGHLWTREFWSNMQEFNNYFLSGFGLMPIYENFQKKEVLLGLMSFVIPLVYMASFLLNSGFLYWDLAKREEIMPMVISLYGMLMYHYFMGRSGVDGYYTVAIPYVFILGFWVKRGLAALNAETQRRVILGLLALVIYALLTNHLYVSYPNLFNLSRNPIVDPAMVQPLPDGSPYFNASVSKIKEEEKLPFNSLGEKDEGIKHENDFKNDDELKAYYAQEFDFSRDAALIDSLTKPSEPVVLLSGFEDKMLMQADRRQFFYYSSILISRPMRMRTFPNSAMFTSGHAQRTLRQLQDAKPTYIFMEKIFLQAPGKQDFKDASLALVLNYIFDNYTPMAQGRYLVAFKRR